MEFDNNFTENIETNYFYNTDIIEKREIFCIIFIILFQEYTKLVMLLISNKRSLKQLTIDVT